jgi:DNA excision repair protein ERCC-2
MHVVAETPVSFLQHLKDVTYIERKPLRFCAERLTSLVRTLELSDLDDYGSLQKVAGFATLVSTYDKGMYFVSQYEVLTKKKYVDSLTEHFMQHYLGFLLILEPFETDTATVPNPILHFT